MRQDGAFASRVSRTGGNPRSYAPPFKNDSRLPRVHPLEQGKNRSPSPNDRLMVCFSAGFSASFSGDSCNSVAAAAAVEFPFLRLGQCEQTQPTPLLLPVLSSKSLPWRDASSCDSVDLTSEKDC